MPSVPPSEQDWERDKSRFVADPQSRDHGAPLGPLAQQFAMLTYSLLDAHTVADVLDQVVHSAKHVIDVAAVVSITLRTADGQFHTPCQTDPIAAELDQVQYDFGEGPCLDAAQRTGPAMATSEDLSAEPKWPHFAPAAAKRGMGALLSTALLPGAFPAQMSGALNIYSHKRHGFDEADQSTALLLATHASLALAHTNAVTQAELRAEQLHRALDSRDVIGQAKGILMGRRGISAQEAFDLLRRSSQDLNVKLVEIAETLTARHTDLLPGDAGASS